MNSLILGIFTLTSILALVTHMLVLERTSSPTGPEKAWLTVVSVICPIVALIVGLTSGTTAMFMACYLVAPVQYGTGRLIFSRPV